VAAIAVGGIVFEQAILKKCAVRIGDRVLMAGEEVFDLEADLLLYRVTLVELARTFKGEQAWVSLFSSPFVLTPSRLA
jgi:hypothetical protein